MKTYLKPYWPLNCLHKVLVYTTATEIEKKYVNCNHLQADVDWKKNAIDVQLYLLPSHPTPSSISDF